jgi:hypothetical protein
MGYGNAKAIFEHEFNPWLTKSYKNLWFINGKSGCFEIDTLQADR